MAKINVKNTEVTVIQINNEDYICITDMIKAKDGEFFVTDWLRNRNTLEYIGIWEQVYNPIFNYGEFAIIKSKAGLNNFKISAKELIEKTNYHINTDAIQQMKVLHEVESRKILK
jgi:hypothetical protein